MTPADSSRQEPARSRAIEVEFLVDGVLSDVILSDFPELSVKRGAAGGSLLYGTVVDSAESDGLLARFRDFGISVVEFRQLCE
ncbi:MAG: hypothetical protein L0K86_08520 [Actinomycetia bacterium]|nr:hypothetical protein [Actinomycetes bacterium]